MDENPTNEASNVGRSSSPPKLFGSYLRPPTTGPTEQRPRLRCQFCNRTFLSSQSLGGHQNAHQRERRLRRFRPRQVQQKVLVPRPDFVVAASGLVRNLPPPSQPPSSLSSSSVPHVELQGSQVRPPWIMDCPSPTTSTRGNLKEANNKKNCCVSSSSTTTIPTFHQFHDLIHVNGGADDSGASHMEDVNIDLRL